MKDRFSAKYNWLIKEKSPYLLQHATNPVNWLPWTPAAFQKAKREGKPVLVSIGYSACHWCHVMAGESFEDQETAALLNENYVSIKVDREERPDIDAVYMKVCQTLTGQGGWPLNVFLTPDQTPFYAGTYFPLHAAYGHPAFKDVLRELKKQYDQNPDKIAAIGSQIMTALAKQSRSGRKLTDETVRKAYEALSENFDPRFGGFGDAPKFPAPHQLIFLLRFGSLTGKKQAMDMAVRTLRALAEGGIRDHIGGGFCRYATDRQWQVPHFEKMLYDQAMLAAAFTEAYQATGEAAFRDVVATIFDYCERDLLSPAGGFYCSEDADSEGEEGKYYLWNPGEVRAVLGADAGLFCEVYHITDAGNFHGQSIPHLSGSDLGRIAEANHLSLPALNQQLAASRHKLFAARQKRVHPFKDDKILTSWNALMIAVLAEAGRVLHNKHYVNLAKSCFHFIDTHLVQDSTLLARYRDEEARFSAYLDDYAFLTLACEAMYEATFDLTYLEKMKVWGDRMTGRFMDREHGGFFMEEPQSTLIIRNKEAYDSAVPSGNSAAVLALLRLSERTGDQNYIHYADQAFAAFADEVSEYPAGYTFMLSALMLRLSGPSELVALQGAKGEAAVAELRSSDLPYLPGLALYAGDPCRLSAFNENIGIYSPIAGRTTYFFCQNFICHLPVTEFAKLKTQLNDEAQKTSKTD
ncbi:thioredoxin domain-containing protein [Sporolactobacillus vineae]|uniref:thioredoxin domain-containing protein n=1 Tax=Sporolactobacillus vineae TaxID=444463 RepID=UPI0004747B3E|nr:thioredoxin domain-containing protein [Sporolactobacillus vineae]